jgi:hypothetical protein
MMIKLYRLPNINNNSNNKSYTGHPTIIIIIIGPQFVSLCLNTRARTLRECMQTENSNGVGAQDYNLLECDTVQPGRNIGTFWRNLWSLPMGKSTFLSRTWNKFSRNVCTYLHGVASQNTVQLVITAGLSGMAFTEHCASD